MKQSFGRFCVGLAMCCLLPFLLQAQEVQFSPLMVLSNKETRLTFSTPTNLNYDLQVSSNLNQWDSLATFLATNVSLQHTDSAAPFLPYRFYRGLQGTGTNAVTGDHLVTDDGDVVIHPRNHAEIFLQWNNSSNTVNIVSDPTNRIVYFTQPDLILLTHPHNDHFSLYALTNLVGPTTQIIASKWANSNLTAGFKAIATVLTNTAKTNFLGIDIEAIAAYNTTPGKINNHPTNAGGCGFILTIAGKRIYIPGDTEDTPEMRALRNIDVAFLPMNTYTMTTAQGVTAVRAFVPNVMYPFHTAGTAASDLAAMKSQIMTNPAVEVRLRKWY